MTGFRHQAWWAWIAGAAAGIFGSMLDPAPAQAQFTGPGVYQIRVAISGKVLDVDSSWWRGHVEGMPLIQWDSHNGANQQFQVVVEARQPNRDLYSIRPLHSGQCLDAVNTAADAPIQQRRCNGGLSQRFYIYYSEGEHYVIQSVLTQKTFSVGRLSGGDDRDNGARVIQITAYWRYYDTMFDFIRLR